MYGKGKITVEIFDEKGNLEKTYKKDNYIKDLYLEAKSSVMAHTGFHFTPLDTGIRENHVEGIHLTDFRGAPDPINDRWVTGRVIAAAGGNTVTTEGVVGSFNVGASSIGTTFQRRVYDWSVIQGNGTFSSIYMTTNANQGVSTAAATVATGNSFTQSLAPLFTIGLPFNYTTMKLYEGKFYFQNGTSLHVIEKFNFESLFAQTVANASEIDFETYPLPASVNTFEIVNGEIYMQIGNNISVANLETPTTQVRMWTSPLSGLQSICYCARRNAWFVHHSENIHVFGNNNFEGYVNPATQTFPSATGAPATNRGIMVSRCGNAIIAANSITSFVDNEAGQSGHLRLSSSTSAAQHIGSIIEVNDEFCIVRSNEATTNALTICVPSSFLSRVVLPEPITKRDDQSMRIIYEYIIPEFELTPYGAEVGEDD